MSILACLQQVTLPISARSHLALTSDFLFTPMVTPSPTPTPDPNEPSDGTDTAANPSTSNGDNLVIEGAKCSLTPNRVIPARSAAGSGLILLLGLGSLVALRKQRT